MKDCVKKIVVRDHFSVHGRGGGQDCASWGPSLTDQSQSQDCDVNVIMARFAKSGVLPHVNVAALYGDFTDVPTYQESLEIVRFAQEQFMGLNAKVRRRFDNDPAKFLQFVEEPGHEEEMISLGMCTREQVDAALKSKAAAHEEVKTPPSQPAPAASAPPVSGAS